MRCSDAVEFAMLCYTSLSQLPAFHSCTVHLNVLCRGSGSTRGLYVFRSCWIGRRYRAFAPTGTMGVCWGSGSGGRLVSGTRRLKSDTVETSYRYGTTFVGRVCLPLSRIDKVGEEGCTYVGHHVQLHYHK